MQHVHFVSLPISVDGKPGQFNPEHGKIEAAGPASSRGTHFSASLTMARLLENYPRIDWMHMCVQGHHAALIRDPATRAVLSAKVFVSNLYYEYDDGMEMLDLLAVDGWTIQHGQGELASLCHRRVTQTKA